MIGSVPNCTTTDFATFETQVFQCGPHPMEESCYGQTMGCRYEIGRIDYDTFRAEALVQMRYVLSCGRDPFRGLSVGAGLGGSLRGLFSSMRRVVDLPSIELHETNVTTPPGYTCDSSFLNITPHFGFLIDDHTLESKELGTFDLVLLERVLEWCEDPLLALRNIILLTGENGLGIIVTPNRFRTLGDHTLDEVLALVTPTLVIKKARHLPQLYPDQPQLLTIFISNSTVLTDYSNRFRYLNAFSQIQ